MTDFVSDPFWPELVVWILLGIAAVPVCWLVWTEVGEYLRPASWRRWRFGGYPKPCECCGERIESANDLDWHGLGNCVDCCDCVFENRTDCDLCKGEGSVAMARRKGLVR